MERQRVEHTFNLGRMVRCDLCNKDWTDSDATGGLIFGSKAVCPTCEPSFLQSVKNYQEEHFIKALNNDPKVSFADFVRKFRGGDAVMKVISF